MKLVGPTWITLVQNNSYSFWMHRSVEKKPSENENNQCARRRHSTLSMWVTQWMGEETVATGSECFTFSFPGLSSVGVFSPAAESFDIDYI